MKINNAILFLLLSILISSCSVKKKIQKRDFEEKKIEFSRQKIEFPDFKLRLPFRKHTIDTLKINDTITVVDRSTLAELRLWKDKYGDLQAECEAKGGSITTDSVTDTDTKENTVDKDIEKKPVVWLWIAVGAGGILLLQFLFRILIKGMLPIKL